MSDEDALVAQITENVNRQDIHPMEEAASFEQLHKLGNPIFVEAAIKLLGDIEAMSRDDKVSAVAGFLVGTYDSGIRNTSLRCQQKEKPILAAEIWSMQEGEQ